MKLRIHQITWNVASTYPLKDDYYQALFGVDEKLNYKFGDLPDIFVISLQEQSIGLLSLIENQWESKFKSFFKILRSFKHVNYIKMRTNSIFFLYQYIFVKAEHLRMFKSIETMIFSSYAGINGKGTIAYKFRMDNESFTFLTAHLNAHDYGNEDRINHYKKVMKEDVFYDFQRILTCSFSFYAGDLNFRLVDLDKIQLINDLNEKGTNEKFLESLLSNDQLTIAQRNKEAFEHYQEGKITFRPTFKYHLDSKEYNPKRTPSYCDRILYRSKKDKKLTLVYYNSVEEYIQSDHRPVIAVFDLDTQIKPIAKNISNVKLLSPNKTEVDSRFDVWLNKKAKPDNYQFSMLISKADVSPTPESSKQPSNRGWDWIGLFKEDFDDLDDYLAYLYVEDVPCNEGPPEEILMKMCNIEKGEEAQEIDECKELKEDDEFEKVGLMINPIKVRNLESLPVEPSSKEFEKPALDSPIGSSTPTTTSGPTIASNLPSTSFSTSLPPRPATSKPSKEEDLVRKKLEWTKVEFSEQTFTEPGKYVLIYFNGDRSVEYISEPFEVLAN